jgi:DNA-binding response OmpR family regulator
MQILVIEDERRMAELLEKTMTEEGHQVVVSREGREGYEIARTSPFDVVVLDVMLPGMDGVTVARRLRENKIQTPILMLTARDTSTDIVSGLDSGADDYLTKPFSIDVLLARIRALSRRGAVTQPLFLEVGDLRLNPASHTVTKGGESVNLTPREYQLLELLMRNRGRAVSRDVILQSVWGFDHDVSENNLEVFVRQLRLKADLREPKLIHTVRGFGYILREP